MISLDEAKKIILDTTRSINDTESVRFTESHGRIVAQEIISNINVPQINNSSMDGYALISSDTAGSSIDDPVILDITGEVQAGGTYSNNRLENGKAIRIMTGAHIPEGADAVIPFEDTEESDGRVKIFRPVKLSENIRFAGEDILKGAPVIKQGTCIESAHIGLIASVNNTEISVFKKPAVSIISTGNEIVEPGSNDIYGKTINSNAYVLFNEVKNAGGNPAYFGIAKDDFKDIKTTIETALSGDIVICTGGVSMGRYDFIPDVLRSMDAEILVHKIAMKPGKPVLFSRVRNKIFFGLPGNPVSVMVSFIELVRPAIMKMSGNSCYKKPVVKALLKETIYKEKGRKNFIRGIFNIEEGIFNVSTTGSQSSGILNSMAAANCLIILPEEVDIAEKNSYVDIELIKHGEIGVQC